MIETLSRTKESIGRATRLAIDCAKYGIANECCGTCHPEAGKRTSFHRKVDLFFLVDSITQCSHSQKDELLEHLIFLLFKQHCPVSLEQLLDLGQVLRKIAVNAISNTTFQLPGLLSSHLFEEDDDEEEEDNFPSKLYKNCSVTPSDRRHCILEDVDGEIEMEDVSGHDKDDRILITSGTSMVDLPDPNTDVKFQSASNMSEFVPSPDGSPPLPPGSPHMTPPLPISPPPESPPPPPPPPLPSSSAPPHPPPPPPPPSTQQLIPLPPPVGPPPYVQSLPPQPAIMSQHMPPVPSTSQPLAYHPPPLHHEIGGTPSGDLPAHMGSSMQGSHTDAPRGEMYSQHSSFFSPVGGNK
ncbi:ENHANCER OF AG-4 protein [Orobanche gracilis]